MLHFSLWLITKNCNIILSILSITKFYTFFLLSYYTFTGQRHNFGNNFFLKCEWQRDEKAMVLCFVEFEDDKCALTALEALQGFALSSTC